MLLVRNKLGSESLQDDSCAIFVKVTNYYTPRNYTWYFFSSPLRTSF
jgi:hypothetical protein